MTSLTDSHLWEPGGVMSFVLLSCFELVEDFNMSSQAIVKMRRLNLEKPKSYAFYF